MSTAGSGSLGGFVFLVVWPLLVMGAGIYLTESRQSTAMAEAMAERPAVIVLDRLAMVQARLDADTDLPVSEAQAEVETVLRRLADAGYLVLDARSTLAVPEGRLVQP